MKPPTTRQVIARIALIVSVVELSVMLALAHSVVLRSLNPDFIAALNVAILIGITTPLIYVFVISPFVIARDVALAQITYLAQVDPLTQLANRRLLSEHLRRTVSGVVRRKIYGALLLLDLDGFKPINDSHGHDAGDAVLVEISKRLQSVTRSEDVVGRLGGDEFVVLVSNLDVDENIAQDKASRIARELINLVSKPLDFNGEMLQVGASIGIRLLGLEEVDWKTAIGEADIALYHAKQAGKGCSVSFRK